MAQKQTTPQELVDGVFAFPGGVAIGGVGTGIPALLLAKDGPNAQLSNGINLTVRGDFARPRPARQQIALSSPLPSILFQGAAYYKPDSGSESVMVALGGRLFQITPGSQSAATATVTEVTIPGDPNPSTVTQAWMWQAESWLIWTDGSSVPVFFNQSQTPSAFRSQQFQPGLYTLASQLIIDTRKVGNTATAMLNMPYTNGPNFPVFIGAEGGFTLSPQSGAKLVLTNDNATVGKVVPGGTNIVYNPQFGGIIVTAVIVGSAPTSVPGEQTTTVSLALETFYSGSNGDHITISPISTIVGGSATGVVTVVNGHNITVALDPTGGSLTPSSLQGATVAIPAAARSFVVGTTVASTAGNFTNPAHGAEVTVGLQSSFSANIALGSTVFIQGNRYFLSQIISNQSTTVTVTVTAVPTGGGSATQTFPATTPVASNQPGFQLPPGRMGAYVDGRNWVCLPDGQSFIASDLVGYSSGTEQYNFRDAVLSISSNQQLVGGGNFRVPSAGEQITSIGPVSVVNNALGQGPVQIFTNTYGFSCDAPTDNTTWATLTSPILPENDIGVGSTSQWATVLANSDVLRRSVLGISSLLLDQLEFDEWGQVPSSREVEPILSQDNQALLNFASAVVFDNRLLMTANPQQGSLGVYHDVAVVMNFDPLTNLRGKQPACFDGSWDGLNVLQFINNAWKPAPFFNGVQRCFAINYNTTTNSIELWEILSSATPSTENVEWTMETPMLDFGGKDPKRHQLKKLTDGELYIDQIATPLTITVNFRPDYSTTWTEWLTFDVPLQPTYQPRMGLGEPPLGGANGMPLRQGYMFQVQIIIQGQCRFLGGRFQAISVPEPEFAAPFNVT